MSPDSHERGCSAPRIDPVPSETGALRVLAQARDQVGLGEGRRDRGAGQRELLVGRQLLLQIHRRREPAAIGVDLGLVGRERPDLSGLYDLSILNEVLKEKGLKLVR